MIDMPTFLMRSWNMISLNDQTLHSLFTCMLSSSQIQKIVLMSRVLLLVGVLESWVSYGAFSIFESLITASIPETVVSRTCVELYENNLQ